MNNNPKSNFKIFATGTLCLFLAFGFSFKDKIFSTSKVNTASSAKELEKESEKESERESERESEKETKTIEVDSSIKNEATRANKIPPRKIRKDLKNNEQKMITLFCDKRDEVIRNIPLVSDLQKLEEGEVHHIPPGLIETGKRLSGLKEIVLRNPGMTPLQEEANEFYENCAGDDEYPVAIRSLCLFSRLQLAKNRNESFDISPYPLEIKQMVLELAPHRN